MKKLFLFIVLVLFFACEKEPVNVCPIADFEITLNPATVDTFITLKSTSYDENDFITLYKWDIDGDRRFDLQGEELNEIQVIYSECGVKEITLEVLDTKGWSDRITKDLIIE